MKGCGRFSTKSLEEQRQLLGTLEALNGMLLFGLTTAFLLAMVQICGLGQRRWFFWGKRTWVTRITSFWHNPRLQMTKTELQSALAEATQTDKRTAGVFLDTLSALAYKQIKKNGELSCPVLANS